MYIEMAGRRWRKVCSDCCLGGVEADHAEDVRPDVGIGVLAGASCQSVDGRGVVLSRASTEELRLLAVSGSEIHVVLGARDLNDWVRRPAGLIRCSKRVADQRLDPQGLQVGCIAQHKVSQRVQVPKI